MNYSIEKEKQYINKKIDELCNIVNNVMSTNDLSNIENKQKMYAILSFLEFIKAGADITPKPIDSNSVSFIVNMK